MYEPGSDSFVFHSLDGGQRGLFTDRATFPFRGPDDRCGLRWIDVAILQEAVATISPNDGSLFSGEPVKTGMPHGFGLYSIVDASPVTISGTEYGTDEGWADDVLSASRKFIKDRFSGASWHSSFQMGVRDPYIRRGEGIPQLGVSYSSSQGKIVNNLVAALVRLDYTAMIPGLGIKNGNHISSMMNPTASPVEFVARGSTSKLEDPYVLSKWTETRHERGESHGTGQVDPDLDYLYEYFPPNGFPASRDDVEPVQTASSLIAGILGAGDLQSLAVDVSGAKLFDKSAHGGFNRFPLSESMIDACFDACGIILGTDAVVPFSAGSGDDTHPGKPGYGDSTGLSEYKSVYFGTSFGHSYADPDSDPTTSMTSSNVSDMDVLSLQTCTLEYYESSSKTAGVSLGDPIGLCGRSVRFNGPSTVSQPGDSESVPNDVDMSGPIVVRAGRTRMYVASDGTVRSPDAHGAIPVTVKVEESFDTYTYSSGSDGDGDNPYSDSTYDNYDIRRQAVVYVPVTLHPFGSELNVPGNRTMLWITEESLGDVVGGALSACDPNLTIPSPSDGLEYSEVAGSPAMPAPPGGDISTVSYNVSRRVVVQVGAARMDEPPVEPSSGRVMDPSRAPFDPVVFRDGFAVTRWNPEISDLLVRSKDKESAK